MDIDISQLPGILRRRPHYVAYTALVCAALALVFVLVQKPSYRSTAELLIDLERRPAVGASNEGATQTPTSTQQSVGSQIYVLQSRELLRNVVKTLNLTAEPSYAVGGGWWQRLTGGVSKASPEDMTDAVVDALQKNLTIERAAESLVFTVTVKDRDPVMAAKIANGIAEAYLRTADESQSGANLRTSMALQIQAEQLRQRLLNALAAAEKFRAENGLISTGEQGLVTDQQIAGLTQQILVSKQLLEQQKSIAEQAKQLNLTDVESGSVAEGLQSAALTALRTRYSQMLDRQAELSTALGNDHPQLRAIRAEIVTMRGLIEHELGRIRQSAANNYERAKANLAALQARFDELTGANSDSGKARIRLEQLKSEAAAINTVYQSFLTRAEELGRQQDLGSSNSRIISAAIPSATPVQAPKLLVLIAGFLFGTALGSVLAVLRELMSNALRSEQELVTKTGAPVLVTLQSADKAAPDWTRTAFEIWRRYRPASGGKPRKTPRELSAFLAAYLLRDEPDDGASTTLTVLSADAAANAGAGEPVAAAIARQLDHLGKEVFLCGGGVRAASSPSATESGSLVDAADRVRSTLAARPVLHPLEDLLYFERLGEPPRRARRRLAIAAVNPKPASRPPIYFIIDACGTEAADILPVILDHSDVILIQSEIGATDRTDLSMLVAEIEPWREKLIGNILVSKKAA